MELRREKFFQLVPWEPLWIEKKEVEVEVNPKKLKLE